MQSKIMNMREKKMNILLPLGGEEEEEKEVVSLKFSVIIVKNLGIL